MDKHFIFVYGTLRQGGCRAMPELFPDSKFIGKAVLGGRLYDMGQYPALLLDGSDREVSGEVYEVDNRTLKQLDDIEASDDYHRIQAGVSVGGRELRCWVYAPDPERCSGCQLISTGDWIGYSKAGAAQKERE